MTRVVVCGLCPLPFENTSKSFGPGIRTWQMAHALASAGQSVHLIALRIPGTYDDQVSLDREERDGMVIERCRQELYFDQEFLRRRVAEIAPDILVGATLYGSSVLAALDLDLPFWADQFGHVMAEAQAKAHLEKANWPLAHFWKLLAPILARADRLSVVSERQKWAAIGELGLAGRLSHETCGYEFVSVMPCALIPPGAVEIKPQLRGRELPSDAFVVFWSGGFNVWSDVETLCRGLEIAVERDPRIHLVSTGGEIGGHDEITYRTFVELVAASRFRAHFHLQGWVNAELVPSFQAEADLGILTEKTMYEGQLGSKNRVVQWLGTGLPVVYNRVGDLGDLLEEKGFGLTFPAGDAEALAGRIVWAASHRAELKELAARAHAYTTEHLSFEATSAELVAWAKNPVRAPDASFRRSIHSPADFGAVEPAPVLSKRKEVAAPEAPRANSGQRFFRWLKTSLT